MPVSLLAQESERRHIPQAWWTFYTWRQLLPFKPDGATQGMQPPQPPFLSPTCDQLGLFTSGQSMKESLTPKTSLRDEQAFPSFEDCPHENDVPYTYYGEREAGVYHPIRHWCFLGEITDRLVFNRLCLRVKDRSGEEVPANFHLTPREGPRMFTPGMSNFPVHGNIPESLTEKGNTLAILYGQQHNFMDGSIGFRIEEADLVQFFPCTLERLLALNDRILTSVSPSDGVRTCYKCNATANQRCSGCHVTWYCGKDCQVGDWSDGGHKKECKLLNQVATLMRQDWVHFHKHYTFPLPKE
ncbi:hypothetical protein EI94DRAFT_1785121 [Lactarius quietus]|nr:hypothetical protein EI94DRAFT_1785121 [Lactarius quietus]